MLFELLQAPGRQFGELAMDLAVAVHDCHMHRPDDGATLAATPSAAAASDLTVNLDGAVYAEWLAPDSATDTLELTFGGYGASNWVSVGFGTGMIGARALVAWQSSNGVVTVSEFDMASLAATGLSTPAPADSFLRNVTRSAVVDGKVSATVRLKLSAVTGASNGTEANIIWAIGASWRDVPVAADVHTRRSARFFTIDLVTGAVTKAVTSKALLVHAVLMGQ